MNSFLIESPAFEKNASIPAKYTCDGEDINPPLLISGVPENTKSLLLILEDPDVPKNLREDGMWNHWIRFNIPPDTAEIREGVESIGVAGRGTSENLKYHGPCPPDREHRYFFKLYALDIMLDLQEGADKEDVLKAAEGHIIDKTELVGKYDRGGRLNS